MLWEISELLFHRFYSIMNFFTKYVLRLEKDFYVYSVLPFLYSIMHIFTKICFDNLENLYMYSGLHF